MLMYLVRKLIFFILYALVISGVTGLLFLDVNYLHNGVLENSLTEISQELALLIIAVLLFYEANKKPNTAPCIGINGRVFSVAF
ncbi:hypothetical protein [Xenorhabdus szentirmaii]|uniref:Uncharacterized protein n=1 Tax=Xenorhabdus szentirmaii DSM 16338 TaxID=1427518 RepID=W1ISN5_9GAMM|nr:hypothetical protein [Xenorhabdus szentirmaii]CDL80848.1 conserved hypothetical protein [Xenorhabdus szentirmaii DSM 16338]